MFAAVEKELFGRPGIQLSFKRNEHDRKPWIIRLTIQTTLEGYGRFPAAYQFLEETEDRPWPIIRVVAAPGVSVSIQDIPTTYIAGTDPALEFYRVQDPEIVPPMAHDITPFGLTGQEEVNPPAFAVPANMPETYPENYFRVERQPSEVVIRHPFSRETLSIEVPQFTRDPRDVGNAQARFCYEFNPEGVLGSSDQPLLRLVKTPAVKLTIAAGDTRFLRLMPQTDLRPFLNYVHVFEVDDINAIPPQGDTIIRGPGWREVNAIDRVPPLDEEVGTALIDTSIGLIPLVGDIVDVAELVYGVATGRDRWGRRVTTDDLVIMGIGALLPFVGSAALRGGSRLIRRFGRRAQTVEDLLGALQRASLSGDDAKLVRQMENLIRAGGHPSPDMYRRFSDLVRRVHGKYPALDTFLNAERTGFTHPTLQEAYQKYKRRLVRSEERPASPREWAIRQKTGAPRRILESLLGPEYAQGVRRVANARFINVSDIPRPAGLTDEQMQETMRLLLRDSVKMTERLDTILAHRVTGGIITRYLARIRLNSGHFRILKGNLGELLSAKIQREILAATAARERGARLISGVRIRVADEQRKLGRSVLFTDNIIAVERDGNLHLEAVFEVKAGYEGGLEGQGQIFRWIEDRITPGSQLVLPRGTRVLSADGTETILRRERVFTYGSGASGSGQVIGLTNAERHLVVGRGTSHLGIDSPQQVAAKVTPHYLGVSSAEMDFLAGQFIASTSW